MTTLLRRRVGRLEAVQPPETDVERMTDAELQAEFERLARAVLADSDASEQERADAGADLADEEGHAKRALDDLRARRDGIPTAEYREAEKLAYARCRAASDESRARMKRAEDALRSKAR